MTTTQSSAPSTADAARWRSSSRRTSRRIWRRRIPLRCRRSWTRPTTTPRISRSAMRNRWSARFPEPFKCSGRKASASSRRSPRPWRSTGCGSTRISVSRDFIIPGVVALVLALVGSQLTSLTLSREWERGTMEVLVSTPVTRMELMAGKILPYFFIGLVDAALCLVIAVYLVRGAVPRDGHNAVSDNIAVPRCRLGPWLFHFGEHQEPGRREPDRPRGDPPCRRRCFPVSPSRSTRCRPSFRAVTYLVPARYYFAILKAVFLKGSGLGDLIAPIALLALYAAIVGLLAARAFRKTLG